MSRGNARACGLRPLTVRPALARFQQTLMNERGDKASTVCREGARKVVLAALDGADTDSVSAFERVLNGCLDAGYRMNALAAFVYEVLHRRFAGRIRRRLSASGQDPNTEEVADLVMITVEAVHSLIRNARRERHSLRYALLVSIADHRTIDFLRRKRPEYRESVDDRIAEPAAQTWWGSQSTVATPEQNMHRRQRLGVARKLRSLVLSAVNDLPPLERGALILVEVEGYGYDAVAERLGVKRTDVGNLVRRARLRRDRAVMPLLRSVEGLNAHVGFSDLRANQALRLNLLRWTTEMGDGVCRRCIDSGFSLHTAQSKCIDGHVEVKEVQAAM